MWYFWTQFWHKAEIEKQEIGQKLDQNVKTKNHVHFTNSSSSTEVTDLELKDTYYHLIYFYIFPLYLNI